MLNISSIAKAEKNKLHTDSAFIVLARIVPPASTGVSEICIAHNNEDIVWQGKLWQAFPFGIGDSKTDNTGSEPSIEFKVSNVSRTLTYLLEQAGGGTGSKVYIYVVNTAEIKGENQHSAGLADPTFTRASTAYADSGSVVAANVPRMSGRGLLIEQEFNNLAPNGNLENGLDNNWYCNQTCTLALNNGVLVSTATGTDYLTQVMITNIALPQNSTHSIYISCLVKNDSAVSENILRLFSKFHSTNYADTVGDKSYPAANTEYLLSGIIAGSGTNTDTTYDVSIQTAYANATTATGHITTYKKFIAIDLTAMFGAGNEPTAAVCDLLFNKPIYGDKKSDTLTIPGTAINAEQGTIEFDCIMEQPSSIKPSGVDWVLFSGVGGLFSVYQSNNSKNNLGFSRGTWPGSISTTVYWRAGDKLHIRARWNGTNIYFDATNKTTNVSVSGTNNNSVSTTITSLNFSNAGSVGQPINAYYSNLRISNVCRPDNDTTPAVDEHTTYYMPLTDNMNFTAQAELEEQYTVGKTSVDENWVTFTLGAGYSLRTRRPFYRYMKNSCPFKYKGTRCACTSSEATCRHTLADCRARGNSKRYGGFPGIDQKGLYLE